MRKAIVKGVSLEIWLLLLLFILAGVLNYVPGAERIVVGIYSLPAILSAYFLGKRHATLTAVASLLLVVVIAYFNPDVLMDDNSLRGWLELLAWGATLMVTAYLMGVLYEHNENKISELRRTYNGLLLILQQFISKDKYTQNHSYRVSVYAATLASYLGLGPERVEDVRAAALLHDVGKLDVSREILYKAARLSAEEFQEMKSHVERGTTLLEPVGGSLRRVLPIILAHHDKFDGSGYHANSGDGIPLEARILAVADVYDSLVSDRPYRKAMSPFEAKEVIEKGAGKDFDPKVVDAFLAAFRAHEMEVPELLV